MVQQVRQQEQCSSRALLQPCLGALSTWLQRLALRRLALGLPPPGIDHDWIDFDGTFVRRTRELDVARQMLVIGLDDEEDEADLVSLMNDICGGTKRRIKKKHLKQG